MLVMTFCNEYVFNKNVSHSFSFCMCACVFIHDCVYALCGPGSSVGIATDYGLDGPGIESRWGEIFRPFRPALGPFPASCTVGTGSFLGGKVRPGRAADHSWPSSAVVMEE